MPSVSFQYRTQQYSVRKKSVLPHSIYFSAGSMHTSSIHLFSVVYAQCHLKKPTKTIFSSLHTAVFPTTFKHPVIISALGSSISLL